jgi:hypothetical protein
MTYANIIIGVGIKICLPNVYFLYHMILNSFLILIIIELYERIDDKYFALDLKNCIKSVSLISKEINNERNDRSSDK